LPDDGIIRNETMTRTWTIPIAGGFDPVTISVDQGEGIIRLGVGAQRTGPDSDELRAIAAACTEAANAAVEKGLS
jgi:hypothetical protein